MGILQITNPIVLLVCRFFQGLFSGYFQSIGSIFINEIAPRQILGSFGVFAQLHVMTGFVVAYALGLILQKTEASPIVFYRVMTLANAVIIIVQSILFLLNFVPESPNSLLRKGKRDQAKEIVALFTIPEKVE